MLLVLLLLFCHKLWCLLFVLNEQVSFVSVVYSQSELLKKEVFLVELVDSISMSKESMSHLKAVYFLRPISENIQHMRRQLAKPRFGEYHLCKCILYNWTARGNLLINSGCILIYFRRTYQCKMLLSKVSQG